MKQLFQGLDLGRPATGGVRIELSMPVGIPVAGALAGAVVIPVALLATPGLKLPISPWIIIIAAVVAEAAFAAIMIGIGRRSRSIISVDRNAGRVALETGGTRTELPMGEIASVGTVTQDAGRRPPAETLEFVMKDGRRVPLGNSHPYRPIDVARALEALRAEMGARGRMVG